MPLGLKIGMQTFFLGLQRYLKKSNGSYVIAVDWSISETAPFGSYLELNMDPETAYSSNTNARVYLLERPPEPSPSAIPSSTDVPISSQPAGMSLYYLLSSYS